MQSTRKYNCIRRALATGLWLFCWPALSGLWAQQTLQINVGGASSAYLSQSGDNWQTDQYFSGGDLLYTSDPIANTQDRYLYATARQGLYDNFQYSIPLANGSYKLTLKFAEIYYWNAGNRVFNVVANGQQVLTNYDIVADVGARNAVDKSFPVTVANGVLNIQFIGVVHFGVVSAIMVEPSGTQPVTISVNPAQMSVMAGQTGQFTATVGGTSDARVTWSATEGAISATGLYTAPATITQSYTATVSAASVADSTRTAAATVNLKTPVVVLVNPGTGSVPSGGTLQLNALVSGTSDARVTWSATAGSTSANGLFTAPAVTATTPVTVTAQSVADATVAGVAQITVTPPAGTGTPGPATFLESGGQATVEAEDGAIINRTQSWTPQTAIPGYSGTAYLQALPDIGVNQDSVTSPEVQFRIKFSTPGTYYVWVRGYAAGPAGDSVNVGIDGAMPASGMWLSQFSNVNLAWAWASAKIDGSGRITLNVPTAGVHVVSVWMREDGFCFDKILLTTSSSFTPTGLGLAESPTDSGSPVLNVSTANLSFSATAGSNPAAQTVGVSNLGAGSMPWTASANQPWLSVTPGSGTDAAALTVAVNAAGLAVGNYAGVVTVTATGAAKTVNVALAVTAAAIPPALQAPPATLSFSGTGNQWYVSPAGSPTGNGGLADPWDIVTALNGPSAVKPGDTIWLRGGTYGTGATLYTSHLAGTASAPIIVRQYPGERATINGNLGTYSPYTWYWGFEIMSTRTDRSDTRGAPECFDTYDNSIGVKIINMVLHDCAQGIGYWSYAQDTEAHGNVIYYNGYQGPGTDRGHGHGIYTQNQYGNKLISDNIIFDQFGLGIQAYGSGSAYLQNVAIDGNIVFNNGSIARGVTKVDNILVAVGSVPRNIKVTNNYTYHTLADNDGYSRLGWPWSGVNADLVATNNYWIGGESTLEIWNWNSLNFSGNTIYGKNLLEMTLMVKSDQSAGNYTFDNNRYFGSGKFNYNGASQSWAGFKAVAGVDRNSTYSPGPPAGTWAFVRPNKYETGRGNIAIYNWDLRSSVDLDVSGVVKPGAHYEVRDVQNYWGPPVASGTYGGGTISIPMAGLPIAPAVGNVGTPAQHTGTDFGAYVIFSY